MPKQVLMPQLGESVVEGTITKWLKAKGEHVDEYEPLLEINTDKVDTEVPSPAAGILLDILIPEGTVARAGSLLAWIGEVNESASQAEPAPQSISQAAQAEQPAQPAPTSAPAASSSIKTMPEQPQQDLGFISPVVRRMAQDYNLDLRQIPGTGLGGRITKQDVLNYLEKQPALGSADQMKLPDAKGTETSFQSTQSLGRTGAESPYPTIPLPGDEILPLSPVRRSIAEHMVFSEHTSPHVTTVMEADLSRVVAHRGANKETFSQDGINLTFTAYFVAVAAVALMAYPIVNSSWSEAGVILHHTVNIGMATSLGEAGLIVPVIRNVESLSLLGIARAVNDMAVRARNRQLKPDEIKGGTFTITNHGTTGSLFATPIINQPQSAILGVGAIQKRAVVISDGNGNDALAIRPMVYLSLTFDHRILDGAMADTFLAKVVKSLEEW